MSKATTMATEDQEYNDDEDEDYAPEPEDDDTDSGNNDTSTDNNSEQPLNWLPPAQQKEVDDAFEALFGKSDTLGSNTTDSCDNPPNKKRKHSSMSSSWQKKKEILSSVFGGNQIACKLMDSSKKRVRMIDDSYDGAKKKECLIPLKQVIKETKRFAGQDVEIQRTVIVELNTDSTSEKAPPSLRTTSATATKGNTATNQQSDTSSSKVASKPIGIDALLTQINKPGKISTISKTSSDWSSFKETKVGLTEELQQKSQSKDAYLVKQDFLQRVDERRFEHEKDMRSQLRTAAGKVDK